MIIAELTPELLETGFSYTFYRKELVRLTKFGKTTGDCHTPERVDATMAHMDRMTHLDRSFSVPQQIWHHIQKLPANLLFVSIVEGWQADCAEFLPVANKLIGSHPLWQHIILLRDEVPMIVNHLESLYPGSGSIPKLLVMEAQSFQVLTHWGPLPAEWLRKLESTNGKMEVPDKKNWFAQNNGAAIAAELAQQIVEAGKKAAGMPMVTAKTKIRY
jgi:hypothetical protein